MSEAPETAGAPDAGALGRFAARLALAACAGAGAIVPVLYAPPLEAPFIASKTAALEVAAALGFLAFALARLAWPRVRLVARPVVWGVALLLGSTLASWAVAARAGAANPYAPAAIARWACLFGMACGAVVVARDGRARRTLLESVTLGAAIVSLIGLWQHLEITPLPIPVISAPGSTFGNRNFGGETIALSLPFGLAALASAHRAGRRWAVRLLAGALLVELLYLAATRTRGAWLGAALGMGAFVALWRPRLSRRAWGLAAGVVVLAAVVAMVPGARNPWNANDTKRYASGVRIAESAFDPKATAVYTRIGIWRRSLTMWREHPVWGVGPGNWRIWFPRYAEPGARKDWVLTATLIARQAHDDLLERGGETGLVGVLALLALAGTVVVTARRRARSPDPDVRITTAAGAGTLAALVGCGVTGFPLDMPGTLTLAGLGLGLVAAGSSEAAEGARSASLVVGRWLVASAAALVLVGTVVVAERQVRASYWLATGLRALNHDQGPEGGQAALPALQRAQVLAPNGYLIWLRTAQAEMRLQHATQATEAARRALALEPWAPNAWATLASAQLLAGDHLAAHESAQQALALMHDLPEALTIDIRALMALGDPLGSAKARAHLTELTVTPSPDKKTTREAVELLSRLDVRTISSDTGKPGRSAAD